MVSHGKGRRPGAGSWRWVVTWLSLFLGEGSALQLGFRGLERLILSGLWGLSRGSEPEVLRRVQGRRQPRHRDSKPRAPPLSPAGRGVGGPSSFIHSTHTEFWLRTRRALESSGEQNLIVWQFVT